MLKRTIRQSSALVAAGQVTARVLVREAIDNALNKQSLNAIAAMEPERALRAADLRDQETAAGISRGPLHGIPLTVKDLFNVNGLPTAAGTQAPLPPFGKSAAVARLEAAGAIILAKTNMHEVALGLTGENEWTGDVRNPHDPERQAGGSSSGSAVAVAAGIGLASLGTDTGGSIRAPAALCGITGFKPTHGLIPLEGALPLSPTCDHAGPLALDVADARLLTEVLAACSLGSEPLKEPRIGVPRAYLEGRLTPAVRLAFENLLERMRTAGARLVDVSIEDIDLTQRAYTPLVRAEAAFAHRAALADAPEGFSGPVRAALESGARMLASDYLEARENRLQVCEGLRAMFQTHRVEALLLPATPSEAVRRGETIIQLDSGPVLHRDAQLALTAPFSMAGTPAAAIPFGKVNGLPVGVQLVCAWGEDARALSLGSWLENVLAER